MCSIDESLAEETTIQTADFYVSKNNNNSEIVSEKNIIYSKDRIDANYDGYSANIDSFTPESSPSYSPLESLVEAEDQIILNESLTRSPIKKISLDSANFFSRIDSKELKSPVFPRNILLSFPDDNLNCEKKANIINFDNYKILEKSDNYIHLLKTSSAENSINELELILGTVVRAYLFINV
jgi:hypothetical protein